MEKNLSLTTRKVWLLFGLSMAVWLVVIVISFTVSWRQSEKFMKALALTEARSSYNKDLVYHRWTALQGGVYVAPSEMTPPNPYLSDLPDRDITTTSGMQLTLVNPEYMTRQVHFLGKKLYGNFGHITSLNPIRPENKADAWEREALRAFENGAGEFSSVESIDSQYYLRMMRPMVTEQACLKCHAEQGYQVGDIRGGISVSVPYAPFEVLAGEQRRISAFWHGLIALLGIVGLLIGGRTIVRYTEKLHGSEEKYRLIANTAMDGFWYLDTQGNLLEASEAYCRMTGYTQQELKGRNVSDLDELEDDHEIQDQIKNIIQHGSAVYQRRHKCKNGKFLNVEISAAYMNIDGGRINAFIRDITERERSEEALRESEERFRKIFEEGPLGIAVLARDHSYLAVNSRFCRMLGYSADELSKMKFSDITHPDTLEQDIEYAEMMFNGSAPYYQTEKRYITKDKRVLPVSITVSPVTDKNHKVQYTIAMIEDISDRKKLNAERNKAAKLESVGVLAGGIAHDFNNILTAIVGNISLAKLMAIQEKSKSEELLTEAEKSVLRAKALTHQLLTFSKGGEPVKKAFEINSFLMETISFALRGSNVKCVFNLSEHRCVTLADEGQIGQVINNLVINAVQAMPDGGLITISTEIVNLEPGDFIALKDGKYIKITVRDQGHGIPDELKSKIFDPYFTTKKQGSGLGLATSYSIVKRHGGGISVESEQGEATTFFVYLPLASEEAMPESGHHRQQAQLRPAKILVMDDELSILTVVKKMLEHLGQEVVVAPEGVIAVNLYKEAMEEGKPFDIAILDFTIPGGMGGRETLDSLKEIDPNVSAIVSSGYSIDPVFSDPEKYGFRGYISKPYKIEELQEVLAMVLEYGNTKE